MRAAGKAAQDSLNFAVGRWGVVVGHNGSPKVEMEKGRLKGFQTALGLRIGFGLNGQSMIIIGIERFFKVLRYC